MEDQLVQVLANTQLAAEAPRKQAELDLKQARLNPAYPLSLANIGKHASISIEIRQAALSALRLFIENNWSGENDEGNVIPISDAAKEQIRPILLELALSADQERKIKTAARYVTIGSAHPSVAPSCLPRDRPARPPGPLTRTTAGPVTNQLFRSFAVGRIANADFPEQWPALLPRSSILSPLAPTTSSTALSESLATLLRRV